MNSTAGARQQIVKVSAITVTLTEGYKPALISGMNPQHAIGAVGHSGAHYAAKGLPSPVIARFATLRPWDGQAPCQLPGCSVLALNCKCWCSSCLPYQPAGLCFFHEPSCYWHRPVASSLASCSGCILDQCVRGFLCYWQVNYHMSTLAPCSCCSAAVASSC